MAAIADIHAEAIARAYEAGVTTAVGTDVIQSRAHLTAAWGQSGAALTPGDVGLLAGPGKITGVWKHPAAVKRLEQAGV